MAHFTRSLSSTAVLLAIGSAQAATVVYSNDYDNPFFLAPGVTRVVEAGGSATADTIGSFAGSFGKILRNSTTGMTGATLSNLPSHDTVDINFVLAFLDSWDSTNGSPAPDLFNIYIEGALVLSLTSNQASGSVSEFGGGTLLFDRVQFDSRQFYSDVVVDMSTAPKLTFAHTGSTLSWAVQAGGNGWQGGTDEAWGVDNLVVTVSTTSMVPEPATYALFGLGLVGLGIAARRRSAN